MLPLVYIGIAACHPNPRSASELRVCLETLRVETDRQSSSHLDFAASMRRELENPAAEFMTKQSNHKKTFQANIEKSYKAKQTQEKYVEKVSTQYRTYVLVL